MKVLLVGADATIREERRRFLADSGMDADAVSPEDAEGLIADPVFGCLVLGSSLDEPSAEHLAARFNTIGEDRFVVRVIEPPVAKSYSYADFVVNPNNPAALLAAVKALGARWLQRHESL